MKRDTATFDISFKPPEHGWLPVKLAIEDATCEFAASYVLCDPATDFASATLSLLNGADSATVRLWLEPKWSILTLKRCCSQEATVTFQHSTNERGTNPESVISTTVQIRQLCRLIAKRLRDMHDVTGADRYSLGQCAGKKFPDREISSIFDALRTRRCL